MPRALPLSNFVALQLLLVVVPPDAGARLVQPAVVFAPRAPHLPGADGLELLLVVVPADADARSAQLAVVSQPRAPSPLGCTPGINAFHLNLVVVLSDAGL